MANKYMKGMLSVTSHQGNRNQNHNEKPPHPCMSNDYPKKQDEKEKSNKTKTISKSRDHPMLKGNSRANSAVGLVSPVISLLSIQHPGLSTQKVLSFFSFWDLFIFIGNAELQRKAERFFHSLIHSQMTATITVELIQSQESEASSQSPTCMKGLRESLSPDLPGYEQGSLLEEKQPGCKLKPTSDVRCLHWQLEELLCGFHAISSK